MNLSDSDDDLPLAVLKTKLNQSTNIASTTSLASLQRRHLRKDVPTLARECDRHGLSDRSAAALASAVLQDFGLISENNSINVIDRNRIRRARKKMRIDVEKKQASTEPSDL